MAGESQQQLLAGVMRPQYQDALQLWFQQETMKTAGWCIETSEGGAEQLAENFYGTTTMRKKTTVDAELKKSTVPTRRRWIFAEDYYNQVPIDKEAALRMAVDPASGIAQAQTAAANRLGDQVLFNALIGTAYTGKTMTTPVALPGGGTLGDNSTGFGLDKFDSAVKYLKRFMIAGSDRIKCAWTQAEEATFMNVLQVASRDYSTAMVRDAGQIKSFGMVDFERFEDVFDMDGVFQERMLPYSVGTGGGGGNVRTALMWLPKAAKRWMPGKTDGDVDWLPEKREWIVTTARSVGATRRMDLGVVAVNCITLDS